MSNPAKNAQSPNQPSGAPVWTMNISHKSREIIEDRSSWRARHGFSGGNSPRASISGRQVSEISDTPCLSRGASPSRRDTGIRAAPQVNQPGERQPGERQPPPSGSIPRRTRAGTFSWAPESRLTWRLGIAGDLFGWQECGRAWPYPSRSSTWRCDPGDHRDSAQGDHQRPSPVQGCRAQPRLQCH